MGKKLLLMLIAVLSVAVFLGGCNVSELPEKNESEQLAENNIKAELRSLEVINAYPNQINLHDYPKVLDFTYKGMGIFEVYFCSDVCPENGQVFLIFKEVQSAEECGAVGGKNIIDPAWKGFIGCSPVVE